MKWLVNLGRRVISATGIVLGTIIVSCLILLLGVIGMFAGYAVVAVLTFLFIGWLFEQLFDEIKRRRGQHDQGN